MATSPKTTIVKLSTSPTTTTYNVTYLDHNVTTTVTTSATVVTSWINHIRSTGHDMIVGLDTESLNPVSTLQLCVSHNCLIYQIQRSRTIPESLRNFLGDKNWIFSGVGVKSDVKLLTKDYKLNVAKMVDVSRLAAKMGKVSVNAGLKEVTNAVLGWEVEKRKEVTMSEWGKEVLNEAQVMYACLDAFLSSQIAKQLIDLDRIEDIIILTAAKKKNK